MPHPYVLLRHFGFVAGFLALLTPIATAADLKLAKVFSDHMVLQRDKPVPVWGWTQPGASVSVSFAGKTVATKADEDGKWSVVLSPLKANATPQSLTVSEPDGAEIEVTDVLVGEVWLGSGQSNMAMTVSSCLNFEDEKATAKLPTLRHFREASNTSSTPSADCKGAWEVCTPETVGRFSATLYFFGRELHRELGVPVGIINSSVGGTPIESWIDRDVQLASERLRPGVQDEVDAFNRFDEAAAREKHDADMKRWQEQVREAKQSGTKVPARPRSALESHQRKGGPGGLFNGKIAPLIPYAIRGVVWYQGEANSRNKANLYGTQLSLLVNDWRHRWNDPFPFAWVQLPNFQRDGEGWMEVRQQMLETLKLPKTGMAITTDVGDPKDIHPKNKQAVGKRLSLWALGTVYDRDVPTSGPLPASHEARENTIVVRFKHTDGGLVAKGGKLKGFEVRGQDGDWQQAKARIDDDRVIISSDAVAQPIAVRYAWSANPDGNLYNGADLPASPFRFDK